MRNENGKSLKNAERYTLQTEMGSLMNKTNERELNWIVIVIIKRISREKKCIKQNVNNMLLGK